MESACGLRVERRESRRDAMVTAAGSISTLWMDEEIVEKWTDRDVAREGRPRGRPSRR